jgi:hypothetical protein
MKVPVIYFSSSTQIKSYYTLELPLVDKEYTLQKFPGKGGWTFAEIPEIAQDKHAPFGWVRVKGKIDTYEFEKYHLMPMGSGRLFLPVKAEVRKRIKKQAGDVVTITLYPDNAGVEVSHELKECLKSEPKAYAAFLELNENKQQEFIDWIYSAKDEETKVERIVQTIEKLLRSEPLR